MRISPKIIEEVKRFLKINNTAVVATSTQGEPHASTVHYIVDEDWNFYFLTNKNTKKYSDISLSPQAAIVVGVGPKHISVQARGLINTCPEDESERILNEFSWLKGSDILDHLPLEEMSKFQNKDHVMIKFQPLQLTYMNLDDGEYPDSLSNEYHKIL